MRAVVFLAWARLRHRPTRWLLVAFGMAGATILPVLTVNSSSIVATQALRHGIEALPAGQRSLTVSFDGLQLPPADLAAIDAQARARLSGLAAQPARRELLYRRLGDTTGGSFSLGAADDLTSAVRVTSGRAPVSCRPEHCEVVVVGDGTPPLDPELGLVVVGRAVRTDPLLLTGTFDPGLDAPLLLVDGVDPASRLAALNLFQRAYGWVTPVDLDRVRQLGVAGYLARSARVPDAEQWHTGMVLTAPDDVMRAEDARARRSAGRFALLGGAAIALLLGFAVIGAIGLRRDHGAVIDLVRRRGGGRRATRVLTGVQAAVPVLAGTAGGLVVGGCLAAARAAGAGLPGWASARDAVAGAALPVGIGAVAAMVVVAATLSARGAASAATVRRAVDLIVLAGLAAAALALGRGTITTGDVAAQGDPLLLALPVIAVVCGGLAAGRLWPAVLTPVARLLPHHWIGLRLGLLGALRRPLRPVATVAFLASAVAIVVFAGAYRATLGQGAVDQAAFAVPLDARIGIGPSLDRPLDVAGTAAFAASAPGVTVHPVIRAAAGVRVSAAESMPAELVGVDPDALTRMRSWDADVGTSGAADAARRIAAPAANRPGLVLPPAARSVAIDVSGDVDRAQITAWLRTGDGRDVAVSLEAQPPGSGAPGGTGAPGGSGAPGAPGGSGAPARLTAPIPAGLPAPTRLFALALVEPADYSTHHLHHIGEGTTDVPVLAGSVTLGTPSFAHASAQPLTGDAGAAGWAGWDSTGAQVSASAPRLTIAFQFTGQRVVVRPGGVTAPPPVAVLADPVTAAAATNGVLQLVVGGGRPVSAHVVRVVPRFPTTGDRFVVADVRALADALDAGEPGTGSVSELWLWAPDASAGALARGLAGAPFDRLAVDLRQVRQEQLAGDPVARGAANLLTESALVAVLVGILAVVLLVVAERRDESAELYAWESDGVRPGTLRLSLFARAAAVVAGAVPAGLLVGLGLSRVTAMLVQVTAVGTAPKPPLTLATGPAWVVAVLGLGVVAGLGVAAAVAGTALRERLPRRPEELFS